MEKKPKNRTDTDWKNADVNDIIINGHYKTTLIILKKDKRLWTRPLILF